LLRIALDATLQAASVIAGPAAIAPRWPPGRPLSLFRRRAPRDRKGDNAIISDRP
jgi:hypothetical protein